MDLFGLSGMKCARPNYAGLTTTLARRDATRGEVRHPNPGRWFGCAPAPPRGAASATCTER